MARRLRYHTPGATYHVMLRGNNGKNIFFSDEDRCQLSLLLQEGVERYGHRVLAYCFMDNHIHLAVQVAQESLSKIIQNVSFRYTRHINKKQKLVGHLFQGRFRSILVDEGKYLNELVRYIHLNPVRAGLVRLPEDYLWSSHNTYLGINPIPWIETDYLLRRFGDQKKESIENFQIFIHRKRGAAEEVDFKKGLNEGIFGDENFVEKVKEEAEIADLAPKINLPELIDHVCNFYETDHTFLIGAGKERKASQARSLLAFLVKRSKGVTLEELGAHLARDPSGLSRQASRFEAKIHEDEKLRSQISEFKFLQMSECQA